MSAMFRAAAIAACLAACLAPAAAQSTAKQPVAQKPSAQPAAPQTTADADIVARVGSRDVTAGEIRAFMAALPPRDQAAAAGDPAALGQLVRAYLVNEVVLNVAAARKWEQRPEVAARIERARREAIIDSFLAEASQPPANYPSDADLQALYDANRTAFLQPRQYQIAQIFVAAPAGGEDKAKARLDEAMARLKQPGADFLVALRADAAAGDRTDDLGWVSEAQLKPEIREQIVGLAKGAVAPPLKLADGWHVLKMIDTKPAATRSLAEVREQLVQRLRQERAAQLRRAVVQDLVRQNPAALNELALARISPTPTEGASR